MNKLVCEMICIKTEELYRTLDTLSLRLCAVKSEVFTILQAVKKEYEKKYAKPYKNKSK